MEVVAQEQNPQLAILTCWGDSGRILAHRAASRRDTLSADVRNCRNSPVSRRTRIEERDVVAIRDAQRHRGPDGEGLWSPRRPHRLGHRRLAIVDLSPLVSSDGDRDGASAVVFNGEIYNFRSSAPSSRDWATASSLPPIRGSAATAIASGTWSSRAPARDVCVRASRCERNETLLAEIRSGSSRSISPTTESTRVRLRGAGDPPRHRWRRPRSGGAGVVSAVGLDRSAANASPSDPRASSRVMDPGEPGGVDGPRTYFRLEDDCAIPSR